MPSGPEEALFTILAAAGNDRKTKDHLKKVAILRPPNIRGFASWAFVRIKSKRH
jgi:hypothetical protein